LPTSEWRPNSAVEDGPWDVVIPDNVADGDYSVGIGLYLPGASRLTLEGPADHHGRTLLGTLHVGDSGNVISFLAAADRGNERLDVYKKNLNSAGRVIDFGTIRTNGSANIVRNGDEWVMQTWPRNADFTLDLSVARFGAPKQVACVGAKTSLIRPTINGGFWRIPLNSARQYRWFAEPSLPRQATRESPGHSAGQIAP
jgi:hypothetical protein